MTPIWVVVVLALLAAGMHGTWNVMLKGSADPLPTSTRAVVASALAVTPLALAAWLLTGRPGLPAVTFLIIAFSALAELAYFNFLSRAYQMGELSVVYPVARGTGPLIAVGAGLLILRERLSAPEMLGVLALLAGIWAVRRPGVGPAVRLALLTGLMIGTYTVLDRIGVRMGPPWLFAYCLWVANGIALAAWTRLRPLRLREPRAWANPLAIGLLMTGAYFLTLLALAIAPVAVVAPLRESAIVLVSAWGVWRMRERRGVWLRLGGAVAILAGIALLALT